MQLTNNKVLHKKSSGIAYILEHKSKKKKDLKKENKFNFVFL